MYYKNGNIEYNIQKNEYLTTKNGFHLERTIAAFSTHFVSSLYIHFLQFKY